MHQENFAGNGRSSETVLYIAPANGHMRDALRFFLQQSNARFDEMAGDIFAVSLGPGALDSLCAKLPDFLSDSELRETKSLAMPAGSQPNFSDLMRMEPLSSLIGKLRGDWLDDMTRGQRLTAHFQPIVYADSPDQTFAFEAVLRGVGHNGELILPNRLRTAARATDSIGELDSAGVSAALQLAAQYQMTDFLFMGFHTDGIKSGEKFTKQIIQAAREVGIQPNTLVMTALDADGAVDWPAMVAMMGMFRNVGLKCALGQMGARAGTLEIMRQARPDFVSLNEELCQNVHSDGFKAQSAARLIESARSQGISTIATGLQSEAEWAWMRGNGADFVQGSLFAEAALPPPKPGLIDQGELPMAA